MMGMSGRGNGDGRAIGGRSAAIFIGTPDNPFLFEIPPAPLRADGVHSESIGRVMSRRLHLKLNHHHVLRTYLRAGPPPTSEWVVPKYGTVSSSCCVLGPFFFLGRPSTRA